MTGLFLSGGGSMTKPFGVPLGQQQSDQSSILSIQQQLMNYMSSTAIGGYGHLGIQAKNALNISLAGKGSYSPGDDMSLSENVDAIKRHLKRFPEAATPEFRLMLKELMEYFDVQSVVSAFGLKDKAVDK